MRKKYLCIPPSPVPGVAPKKCGRPAPWVLDTPGGPFGLNCCEHHYPTPESSPLGVSNPQGAGDRTFFCTVTFLPQLFLVAYLP
jgi:hypothetical protein